MTVPVPDRSCRTFSLLLPAANEAVLNVRVRHSGHSSLFHMETCDGFSEGVGGKRGTVGDHGESAFPAFWEDRTQ